MARVLPKIFKEERGAGEEKGEYARLSSFIGAIAVGDLVKTTLGPKGMDKILQPIDGRHGMQKVMFTNDGATILKSIPVDNAAAKIIVDISKVQDEEVGDGTTSVAVLAAELLREAEGLIAKKIHPQTIIRGWRKAIVAARGALEELSADNSQNDSAFRQDLINIAETTLSSKILSQHKEYFAEMAVTAVLRLKGSTDLRSIQIIKKAGGLLTDSYLDEGFILDKTFGVGQPKRIANAKVLVGNTGMDSDKIKIHAATVKADSVNTVAEIEEAEKAKMQRKLEKVIAHGCNCFINRQLIYNFGEQMFTDAGIGAIEHADFEGVERLALVLGAEVASTFEDPKLNVMGQCELIEEIVIGESKLIRFSGVKRAEACTVVLRGASEQMLDEAERSLHDALCVLSQTVKSHRTIPGGGCGEMTMARAVDAIVPRTAGKEALAIEAFARALRALPTIIADNAGLDSSDLIAKLRAAHHQGQRHAGLDLDAGVVGDMVQKRIRESLKSKMHMTVSAHEAAEMILRVDEIIKCAPRERRERPGGR